MDILLPAVRKADAAVHSFIHSFIHSSIHARGDQKPTRTEAKEQHGAFPTASSLSSREAERAICNERRRKRSGASGRAYVRRAWAAVVAAPNAGRTPIRSTQGELEPQRPPKIIAMCISGIFKEITKYSFMRSAVGCSSDYKRKKKKRACDRPARWNARIRDQTWIRQKTPSPKPYSIPKRKSICRRGQPRRQFRPARLPRSPGRSGPGPGSAVQAARVAARAGNRLLLESK